MWHTEVKAIAEDRATIFKTPTAEDPALTEAVRRLVDAYPLVTIYLFGSGARNDAGADSDYDLLVAVPGDAPMASRRSRLAPRPTSSNACWKTSLHAA